MHSIRAFLDAGGDVTTLDRWQLLADTVLLDRHRARGAALSFAARWLAELEAIGADALPVMTTPLDAMSARREVVALTFLCRAEVELLTDDATADRFEAALPAKEER